MAESLSSVDTAWYRLDSPTDPADIIGVMIFDGLVDYDRLIATIEARFLRFERFRQHIDDSQAGRPKWREAAGFAVEDHVQRIELDAPADRGALEEAVGELMSRPLDKSKPLWRLYLAENYVDDDGQSGSAIIAQLHHCLGDGFALAHVLLSIADHDPDAPWPSSDDIHKVEAGRDIEEHHWMRDVLFGQVEELIKHPSRSVEMAQKLEKLTEAMGHLVLMPFDPPTVLKRDPVGRRRVSWSDGIALDEVKRVARAFDGTVNDVLMAALAGAYRRYLADHDEVVANFDIRALVPVNLRPAKRVEEMEDKLGNHFGLVFLRLPVSEPSAVGRLRKLQAYMGELKNSPEALIIFEIFNLAGHTPETVEHVAADLLAKKSSTVVTNVPGPREPLFLGGRQIKDLMFWAPHPARLGSNASIISYNGKVRVGVRGDENVLPDPATMVDYFDAEFAALARASADH